MGEIYADKYYHKYFDDIFSVNNEILDFCDKEEDSFHGNFAIPAMTDLEKGENENLNSELFNKSVQDPEKEVNQIAIPLQQEISKEKEINQNMNLEKPNESTILQENVNLNEKMEEKHNIEISFLKKTKSSSENDNSNTHTKTNDNKFKDAIIRIACNHKVLKSILDLINNKIKELYNNNIGQGFLLKQLLPLEKMESNIKYNKELLNKTIKDIFSGNIYGKITKLPKDYNKKLIQNLLNEKDVIIKDYFNNLFNLTFIQCLEHYRGTKLYDELNGMRLFEEEESNKLDEDLYQHLKYYFDNYEIIINNKKSRKSRKDKLYFY